MTDNSEYGVSKSDFRQAFAGRLGRSDPRDTSAESLAEVIEILGAS